MYDPTIGQWLSEDPIEFDAEDTNLRRYVGNSPTNFIDPSGLEKYIEETNKDKSTTITVKENWTIILLYGHGASTKPHTFNFRDSQQAGGFIGCDAGATNKKVPEHWQIEGLMMVEKRHIHTGAGNPSGGPTHTRKYWIDEAVKGAIKKAKEWLKTYPDRCKKVEIIFVLAGGWDPTQPDYGTITVTNDGVTATSDNIILPDDE
ncbi:hypothetical protein DTL42_05110 [Bremerella cremea]|uniref:RHS repeat-associated core domain-containing protein n=1 Tax=Bremerella cremea TaxID=1031537 RepID=A0A368KW26_9BACT|nr:RHS repeat-associated core domain-containing protein [Bremerella cremea]RCS54521.1 hypothetical protein DTL42_05110 [Bremerella cremea]